jgi:O-succinylbenzoate synthase
MLLTLLRYRRQLSSPIAASLETHSVRDHLVVQLEYEGRTAWGEVSPQPTALNGDPGIDDVVDECIAVLFVQFVDLVRREQSLPHWSRISQLRGPRSASAVAATLLEMAVLDWELRSNDQNISQIWPARHELAMMETRSALAGDAAVPLATTVQLRVKVDADPIASPVLKRLVSFELPILLDYNASNPSADQILSHIESFEGLVRCVEQPYAPGNLVDHALLANQLPVPLSMDEGVRSRRDLDHIARYGAASMVCLKPARLGGYSVTRSCVSHAHSVGLEPYIGGFFEDRLGRAVNRTLVAASVVGPSDVAETQFEEVSQLWREVSTGLGYEFVGQAHCEVVGSWDIGE